ncbi:MAG: hypothetical protein COV45_08415 [Deltaproteobacteria bacterium CG11_big_fil_rev_8_21_14_0_20_47_16]|nr:MAG: hypothetical protein COV45_08415 [Deltaproteobacteria bacterium CG11_big_fil_rev_8_21_14_0_20_47_16]
MASIVKGVLQEELARSLALKKKYEEKLNDYPQGYLLERKRGGNVYYYLSYREGERILQKYLGLLSPEEVKKYKDQIKDKRALKKQLADVKTNIKYLERLLKK